MQDARHSWGLIAYADTLDTIGIMASDVESVEKVYGKFWQSRWLAERSPLTHYSSPNAQTSLLGQIQMTPPASHPLCDPPRQGKRTTFSQLCLQQTRHLSLACGLASHSRPSLHP